MSDLLGNLTPAQIDAILEPFPESIGAIVPPPVEITTTLTDGGPCGVAYNDGYAIDAWQCGGGVDSLTPEQIDAYCRITASPPAFYDTCDIEDIIDSLEALKDQDPLSWRNDGIQAAIDLIDSKYV